MSKQATESHYRSILKGITWRVIGTLDTFLISLLVSGKIDIALKIGAAEAIIEILLYYLHERAWLYFVDSKTKEKKISAYKSVSWRIIGTINTTVLGWLFTGDASSGVLIGALEVITKLILYYGHERAWQKVPHGTVSRWFGLKE